MGVPQVKALGVAALLAVTSAAGHAEVAIATRYFKTEGTSHHHLYLYSDEGKVIRRLTSDVS